MPYRRQLRHRYNQRSGYLRKGSVMNTVTRALTLVVLLWLSGCARYEYQVLRPLELSGHIGAKEDRIATIDPLEYRFRGVENRLVVRIFNLSDDAIQLLGDQSAA